MINAIDRLDAIVESMIQRGEMHVTPERRAYLRHAIAAHTFEMAQQLAEEMFKAVFAQEGLVVSANGTVVDGDRGGR